jgi:nucleotide-binding universal stress UspA family protein
MAFRMLLATDGSPFSDRAADYCIDMAKMLDADVLALFVMSLKHFEIYALGHHDDITGYEDENKRLMAEGGKALAYVTGRAKEKGVRLETRISRGYPADEIMKVAKDEKFDLIVVGHIGRSGIERVLLGSVSEHIVRNAPCPVLVVRGTQ